MLEIKRAHLNPIIPGQGGTSAWFGAVESLRQQDSERVCTFCVETDVWEISIERWEYSMLKTYRAH